MANKATSWQIIKDIPKKLPTTTSPDSKWGITSIGISIVLFLIPLSISFWAIQISIQCGNIMLPSSTVSWVFFILAIVTMVASIGIAIYTLRLAIRWYVKSAYIIPTKEIEDLKTILGSKLDSVNNNIEKLIIEIRQGKIKQGNTQNNIDNQES